MKKMIRVMVGFIFVVCAVAVAFVVGRRLTENETVTVNDNLITSTETVITGEIIKAGLVDIGELATEEYYYTEVQSFDSSKKMMDFNVPFTTSRFVYSYDGIIKAGIDFAAISIEKDDLSKIITVKLPKAKILSSEIDENSFRIYDEKQSIFNQISISNFNETNADLKARAEEDAIKRGVLDRADEHAILLLKNFLLTTYGISDYAIRIEPDDQ